TFAFVEGSLFAFPTHFRDEFDLGGESYPVVFDERFSLSCEDVDFNHRVQQAGYHTIQVNNPPLQPLWLQHIGHQTIETMKGTDEDIVRITHENRLLLCEKWGVPERIND